MFGQDFDLMVYARDIGHSVDFYQALGFEFKGWWSEERKEYTKVWGLAGSPDYAELLAGPLHLSLHRSAEDVHSGGCIFHLQVEDVDAFYAQVVSKGIEISAPQDEPWGWRMVTLEDPDGHQWGFYTP